jgi:cellulose synthase/poly-beta-1,6-N-acetylglucosamine synthase-like glycosyltransferase
MSLADAPTQLIVVLNNPKLTSSIVPQGSNESVVAAPRKGRGFAFLQGIANVTGNITLLLHSDTIPPIGWDHAILTALEDPQVVGGGFSLTYDKPKPNLDLGTWVMNQWFRISGELYGDRAMFVRSHILKRCLSVFEVPLFEDLRFVQCMHRYGRVVLLKDKVENISKSFREQISFILYRLWYALGGSPFQIYNAYYSTKKMEQ